MKLFQILKDSHTKPIIFIWMLIYPISIVFDYFFPNIVNLENILYGIGAISIAYMGGDYVSSFFKNITSPAGIGSVKNIQYHKQTLYFWTIYVFLIFAYAAICKREDIIDIANKTAVFAMFLVAEYASGNKVNKIAENLGEKQEPQRMFDEK